MSEDLRPGWVRSSDLFDRIVEAARMIVATGLLLLVATPIEGVVLAPWLGFSTDAWLRVTLGLAAVYVVGLVFMARLARSRPAANVSAPEACFSFGCAVGAAPFLAAWARSAWTQHEWAWAVGETLAAVLAFGVFVAALSKLLRRRARVSA